MIKSQIGRCDINLYKCLELLANERVKRNIDNKTESFRRLTKAVANLIMTDTEVRERLIVAILEDDRRKPNGDE